MVRSEMAKFKILEFFIGSLFLLLVTYGIFFNQRILINDGFGWDGIIIKSMIEHFDSLINTHALDFYMLQHIFPQFIFYVVAKIFHIPLTDKNLLYSAYITNYVFIGISFIFFYLIAQKLQLRPAVRILTIIGLFLNFATLKFSGYYAFLPDVTAFSLAFVLYYAYLQEYLISFLLVALAASFTFPSYPLFGLLLFSFRPKVSIQEFPNKSYYFIIGIIFTFIIFAALLQGYNYGNPNIEGPSYLKYFFYPISHFLNLAILILKNKITIGALTPINNEVYLVSLAVLISYLYFTQKMLWKNISIVSIFKKVNLKYMLFYIVFVYGSIFLVKHYWSAGQTVHASNYFFVIVYNAIVNPLCFLVSHFIYYGPIVLLFILFWKPFIAHIKTSSPGIILFAGLSFIIALDSESRHLMNLIPILILILADAINQNERILKKLTPSFLIFFSVISLVISCFWIKIQLPAVITSSILKFPCQSYFMFQGPYLSHTMYYIFLSIFLCALFVLGYYFKKEKV